MGLISPSLPNSWQGIVELILRAVCAGLCFVIMICAAVALSAIERINGSYEEINRLTRSDRNEYENAADYEAAAGWLVFVAVMGMLIEPAIIAVRILNITFVNQNFPIFAIADIIVSGVFALALLAGGASNAAYSSDNNEFYNDNDRLRCENPPLSAVQDVCDDVPVVRNSEAAAAAFSFFGIAAFGALAGIMIFTFLFKSRSPAASSESAPSA